MIRARPLAAAVPFIFSGAARERRADADHRLAALRENTLVGFSTVELPIGLEIVDCPVLETKGPGGGPTVPSKAQIEDGRQRLDANGKPAYSPVLEWRSKKLRDAFSDRVVQLVTERDPGAFGEPP